MRVGLTERSSVHAEVDLSGAPVAVLEPLFGVALDALRWLVEWLAQPVDFLVNGAAGCRALEQLSPIGA